ncbi:MAG: hypothetical protein AMK73_03840 [Planctomycetes bacterium SM23_32]|nr:MAG: hypothetical protein AMK73_03840 [Planctomycetes bacterium SM23_32]
MEMVLVQRGEFVMGSPLSEEGRGDDEAEHKVRITKPFYIGITEVTEPQWKAVMGTEPWGRSREPNAAAVLLSWHDATAFCERVSAATGKVVELPTEAEWEYACRAGSDTTYAFGPDPNGLNDYAWYKANAGAWPKGVRQKAPNAWGLYDMHGNVWEWCQDWWQRDYYLNSPTDDPVCLEPAADLPTAFRALRGGSWAAPPEQCRSANRHIDGPDHANLVNGFRVVLRP